MRLLIIGVACLALSGCVTATERASPLDSVAAAPAPVFPQAGKSVLASTMEVRVDTSAVGGISPDKVGKRLALALATITEFRPESGTAVTPIRSAVLTPEGIDGTTLKTVYTDNAYRQTAWMDDYNKILFYQRTVDPGWYLVHSFGSTAGFERYKPRTGQRACLLYGAKPAPGVEPVALNAGEIGYFGHFVITIAVKPGKDPAVPYALSVAEAAIEPAPPGLEDILRRDGLDPARLQRIPPDRFPCPWTVQRPTVQVTPGGAVSG